MPKRITARGRHRTLPLAGDIVSEVCFSTSQPVTLVFHDSVNGDSQLQIEEAITLTQSDGVDLFLPGSRPGRTFDPKQLHPLLDLLGTSIVDAWAHHDGPLEISFSNGSVLRIVPESGYEAWHFQYPRPGRSVNGNINDFISLHGSDGRLLQRAYYGRARHYGVRVLATSCCFVRGSNTTAALALNRAAEG
jgi:hypothetical protein